MEPSEPKHLAGNRSSHVDQCNEEGLISLDKKKGGWITFPFIIGGVAGLSITSTGWYANMMVYAIKKYNIEQIDAAQLFNAASGFMNFLPLVGAFLADSIFESLFVIIVSSFISLLGIIMFTVSAVMPSLTPPACNPSLLSCVSPSSMQRNFLYVIIALSVIGVGGTRCLLGAIGADQYKKAEHQQVFFNWYICAMGFSEVIAFTLIVYLQDNLSWGLGFGIAAAANGIAIISLLFGWRFYHRVMPQGSPFTSIARVLVASLRNNFTMKASSSENDAYFCESAGSNGDHGAPTNDLSFLNKAALIRGENTKPSQELSKSWRLCTVEEVENLKKLIKVLPIWFTGVGPSAIFAVSSGLITLQALVMDRSLGPHFKIPVGTMFVFTLIWSSLTISILDRVIHPLWKKTFGRSLTPLQRVGAGYFFNLLAMAAYGVIEMKRLHIVNIHHLNDRPYAVAPMSAFWLVFPLALLGIGSGFYMPSEIGFYYQELPKCLRSTATALTSLRFALGDFLGTTIIGAVQKRTPWLPNDINLGRADLLYWLLSILGSICLVCYVTCAVSYKYKNCGCDGEDVDVRNMVD